MGSKEITNNLKEKNWALKFASRKLIITIAGIALTFIAAERSLFTKTSEVKVVGLLPSEAVDSIDIENSLQVLELLQNSADNAEVISITTTDDKTIYGYIFIGLLAVYLLIQGQIDASKVRFESKFISIGDKKSSNSSSS